MYKEKLEIIKISEGMFWYTMLVVGSISQVQNSNPGQFNKQLKDSKTTGIDV